MATSGQIVIPIGDAPPTPPEGTITIYTKVDGGICYKTDAGTEHLFVTASGGGYDHGLTTGLLDDDHTQYHTDARGDLRYYTQDQVDATISGVASTLVVVDKTSSTALTGTELNGLYTITNDGAGGEVILTWPSLVTGQEGTFYVNDAQYLQIKAPVATTIRIGPVTSAAAGYIRSNVVGNWIQIKAMPDGLVVFGTSGTWTYDE